MHYELASNMKVGKYLLCIPVPTYRRIGLHLETFLYMTLQSPLRKA